MASVISLPHVASTPHPCTKSSLQGITELGLGAVSQVVAYAQSAAAAQGDALLLAQALASAQVVQPSSSTSPFAAAVTPTVPASQTAIVAAPGSTSTQQARGVGSVPSAGH